MTIDRIRQVLGVVALVCYVPGLCFWFLIHPFARSWRRIGPVLTYGTVLSTLTVLAIVVFQVRGALLGRDFGTHPLLIAIAIAWFSLLAWLGLAFGRRMEHLDLATRMGVTELSEVEQPKTFVREGIYRNVRHPIYASALVGGIGYALFVNYLGIYVLVGLAIPILYVVTLLEERELVERFGDDYRQYQRNVPRLVPRWGAGRDHRL